MAEAVRRAGDALSCACDVAFLGQASRPYKNNRNSDDPKIGSYHTMPVKLEFEDRQQRIYFEQRMRENCKLRASVSFPPFMQKEKVAFDKAMRELYPDYMIMVRPDPAKCVLTAVRKKDKAGKWTPCPEHWTIPPRAVFADRDDAACGTIVGAHSESGSGSLDAGAGPGMGDAMDC
jgi:hypothetical protein